MQEVHEKIAIFDQYMYLAFFGNVIRQSYTDDGQLIEGHV